MSDRRGVAPAPYPADVGIVAALAIETADVVESLTNVCKYQSASIPVIEGEHSGKIVAVAVGGPGRAAARRATEVLLSGHRPRLVIAAGFAGALDPSLSRNDLILPQEIIDREGGCHAVDVPAELGATIRHTRGRQLTVDHVVLKVAQKAELRETFAADLVDMETSAVAAMCSEKSVRFLSVRVISDDARTDLPREIASVISQRSGTYRAGAALRAVWQRPSTIKDFWSLYEHAIEAAGRLGKFVSLCISELEV
jgi:adenosylhomocysteine nucleosidase